MDVFFYHKMINPERPQDGITELRYIDPRKIKKVIEFDKSRDKVSLLILKSIHLFLSRQSITSTVPKGLRGYENHGIKVAPDAICFCHSGQLDMQRNCAGTFA